MPRKRTSVIWTTPTEDFKAIVEESETIKEVIDKLGLNFVPSHYKTIKARFEEENINPSHFNPYGYSRERKSLESILTLNSSYNRFRLKPRLVEAGLLEEKCQLCGIGNEWNGKPLSLQLDHINGVNDDNRIENLRLLCPNCHSQTETFGARNQMKREIEKDKCEKCGQEVSKNKNSKSKLCRKCFDKSQRKVERPSRETLLSQVKEHGYVGTGRIYGVSDNAIRKWLKD